MDIEYLSQSKIVENPNELLILIELSNYQPSDFKLVYRATRDGFSAKSFHARSKNKERVLAVIRSGSNVFGGYTDLSWNGNEWGYYRSDRNALLFSFRNPSNVPTIYRQQYYNYYSIYDSSYNLLQFGSGADLQICSNANVNYCSYSYLGNAYVYSTAYTTTYGYNYNYNSTDGYGYYSSTNGFYPSNSNYFTGSNYFIVDEIELFQRSN